MAAAAQRRRLPVIGSLVSQNVRPCWNANVNIKLKEQDVTPTEIATGLGIGRASVYRILGGQTGDDRQEAA
jgi:DNA invertase Pin-like site-specific DNA recombinase